MAALPGQTVALGSPASPTHKIDPIQLAEWMTEYEALAGSSGVSYIDGSLAALNARTGVADGEYGLVINGDLEAGVYERVSGSWIKKASIPSIYIDSIAADQAAASAASAASSAEAANVSAGASDVARAGSEEAEAGAVVAKEAAEAAAEASGDVLFYDTKADATAALGGLSEGQIVEVMADESQGGERTRYRVESSALVLKITFGATQVFYVSPSGSDSAAGLSPSSAFATVTKAASRAAAGDTVRLARGGVWREQPAFAAGVIVEPYGSGVRPVISGQDVVSSFTISGGGPSYTFTVELDDASVANRGYPGVFEDGTRLTEIKVGDAGIGDSAAAIAAVAATAGTFYFAGPGTHAGGWSAGAKTYYVHASDGGNPNSNGSTYEVYKRPYAAQGGEEFRNITLHSGWHHDGSSIRLTDGSIQRLARHGNLTAVPQFEGVTSIGDNPAYEGGGFFHSNPNSLQDNAVYRRCVAVAEDENDPNGIGFYSHGDFTGLNPIRELATLIDCEGYGLAQAVNLPDVQVVDVYGFRARNCDTHLGVNPYQTVNVYGADMRGGRGGTGDGGRQFFPLSGDGQINLYNSYFDFEAQRFIETGGTVGNFLAENSTLVLRPKNIAGNEGAFARSTGAASNIKLHDCIVVSQGDIGAFEYFLIGSSASGIEARNVLLVGQTSLTGLVRAGTCKIGGSDVDISTLDASAKVFGIDRAKAVLSDEAEGVRLRNGSYRPGDKIFYGAAMSQGSDQPRGFCLVGEVAVSNANSTYQESLAYQFTPSETLRAVCHMSTGKRYAACGDAGLTATTATNSATGWVEVDSGVSERLNAIAANGAVLVAVGDDGVIVRSDDSGATWTEITNSGPRYTTDDLFGIAANGSTWIAVGAGGRFLRSTDDGATWTASTNGTRDMFTCYRSGIASLFLAGGQFGTLYTSTDGASWTQRDVGAVNDLRGFADVDDQIIGVMKQSTRQTDTFIRSANGTGWTVDEQTLPFEVLAIAGPGATLGSIQVGAVCVGEAQSLGTFLRGSWGVDRILETSTRDASETLDKWLSRAV